jgi:hypothetical protein
MVARPPASYRDARALFLYSPSPSEPVKTRAKLSTRPPQLTCRQPDASSDLGLASKTQRPPGALCYVRLPKSIAMEAG